jgi:hypothetical protein
VSEHTEHSAEELAADERIELGRAAWPVYNIAKIGGIVGILAALLLGYFLDHTFRRFFFAYLVSYAFFLSLALGGIAFVLMQHLTRAGWSVSVRRAAEALGATMPILAALAAPIVVSLFLNNGALYRWAQPVPAELKAHGHEEVIPGGDKHPTELTAEPSSAKEAAPSASKEQVEEHPSAHGVKPIDELTYAKRGWLNPVFFTIRLVVYFVFWCWLGMYYWRQSVLQDRNDDFTITGRLQTLAGPLTLVFFFSLTFAAFDLIMSLDPHWFSTIFGIYFFSGCMLGVFATLVLVFTLLQRLGYMTKSVNTEHYHDLGKWLFAFTFFWGYIAFSQFMLIWYANIPEEVSWFVHRGASTRHQDVNGWSWVSIALLFGQLLIPFGGLMSRFMKRKKGLLFFWSCWILVFHWIDVWWMIMPELDGHLYVPILEIVCFIGIAGLWFATYLRFLNKAPLRPLHDPRLNEALVFQNA